MCPRSRGACSVRGRDCALPRGRARAATVQEGSRKLSVDLVRVIAGASDCPSTGVFVMSLTQVAPSLCLYIIETQNT